VTFHIPERGEAIDPNRIDDDEDRMINLSRPKPTRGDIQKARRV
jgi:hypothetical protein